MNKQNDNRSELQRRLAAELTEKAKKKAQLEEQERPDGVSDSEFVRHSSTTSRFAWFWIAVVIIIVAGGIILAINPS